MPRWSMLLIAVFFIASVIAVDPGVSVQAQNIWEALQPVLADIREGLAVIFHEITHDAPDLPSENIPPIDDDHIYNA